MVHIKVPEGLPGILGPMAISPESTQAQFYSESFCFSGGQELRDAPS